MSDTKNPAEPANFTPWPFRHISPDVWHGLDAYDRAAAEEAARTRLREVAAERVALLVEGPERIYFEPTLTRAEADESEARESGNGRFAMFRRATRTVLVCNSTELRNVLEHEESGQQLLCDVLSLVAEWRSHLLACVNLADAAEARVVAVAGARAPVFAGNRRPVAVAAPASGRVLKHPTADGPPVMNERRPGRKAGAVSLAVARRRQIAEALRINQEVAP